MNGRVVLDDKPGISYDLFEQAKKPYDFNDSLRGIQDESILSKAYFSKKNVDYLQRQIVMLVSKQSGYQIKRQSETELQIIMRSIFLQYSKNDYPYNIFQHQNFNQIQANSKSQQCDIKDQISGLNKKVLNYCVDRIVTEISQFLEYKNTVNKMPLPMSHPQYLSNSGSKSLSLFKPV